MTRIAPHAPPLMSRAGTALAAVCTAVIGAATVQANPVNLPVKWSQPICPTAGDPNTIFGLDRESQKGPPGVPSQILADDFIGDGTPLFAVRWWGSYLFNPSVQPDMKVPFQIAIHFSDANGNPAVHPFSLPATTMQAYPDVLAFQHFVGFDKAQEAVYVYEAMLPTPFPQEAGIEYFISIERHFNPNDPTGQRWGWHDTCEPRLDWAAVTFQKFGPWDTYTVPQPDPNSLIHTNLAFELMTIPEPATAGAMLVFALFGIGRRIRRR